MSKNPRCLFNSDFVSFLNSNNNAILGELCNNFHGSALTTTIEAWKSEIEIMKNIVTFSLYLFLCIFKVLLFLIVILFLLLFQ